jgi:hypothetical protein
MRVWTQLHTGDFATPLYRCALLGHHGRRLAACSEAIPLERATGRIILFGPLLRRILALL